MILKPPELSTTPETVSQLLHEANEVIRWGDLNLVQVHRASQLARSEKLSEEEQLKLVSAYLITSYCGVFNQLMSAEMKRPIMVVADKFPL